MKNQRLTPVEEVRTPFALMRIAWGLLLTMSTASAETIYQIGSWPGYTRHLPSQVAGDSTTAYLVGPQGLQIFDLSGSPRPQALSFLPCFELSETVTDVDVQTESNRVCIGVANPSQLKGIDVGDPVHPTQVWNGDLYNRPSHLCLDENRVYSSHNSSGMSISGWGIDGYGGRYNAIPAFGRVAISSNRLYVPTPSGFDIRDKSSPNSLVGSFNAGTNVNALAVEGTYAYLAAVNGLHVVNVQNETAPAPEGFLELAASQFEPTAIGLVPGHACLLFKKTNQLMAVSVTSPDNPHVVGDYGFTGPTLDLFVNDGRAFVLARPNLYANPDLHVLDLTDPTQPMLEARLYVNGSAAQVALVDTTLLVADLDNGLCLLDVTTPSDLHIIGHQGADGACEATAAAPGLACMSDSGSFSVLDVSDPEAPVVLTNFWGETAQYLELAGDYLCRVGGAGFPEFMVRDMSDNFNVVGTKFFMTDVDAFSMAGDQFALLVLREDWSGPQRLEIIDIQRPGFPVVTDYAGDSNIIDVVGRMDGNGTNAFLATTTGLEILDLSDTNNIASIGEWACPTGFVPRRICVNGNRIGLASTNRLWVIDRNELGGGDPVIAEADITFSFSEMILSGDKLYAAAGADGVIVYQIGSAPSKPTLFIANHPPGQVTLEWSAAGTGWFLEQSGQPDPSASWDTVVGSETVTSTNLPRDASARFFRLRQP